MILSHQGRFLALLVTLASVAGPLAAQAPAEVEAGRRVHALSRLAADEYRIGVDGGRVVSAAEVEEARLFLGEAIEAAAGLPAPLAGRVADVLGRAQQQVAATAPPDSVAALVDGMGGELEQALGARLEPVPSWVATLDEGKQLYAANCASCHATSGRGDGPAAAGMTPAPADLTDLPALLSSSPLDFYRRISLGVMGTSMPAFEGVLSEDERWAVALYTSTLRLPDAAGDVPAGLRSFEATGGLTDIAVLAALGVHGDPAPAALAQLAAVRGAGAVSHGARLAAGFGRVRRGLDSVVASQGDRGLAEGAALSAYMAFEPLERQLRPRDPGLASDLEQGFTGLRLAAASGAPLVQQQAELVNLLDRAERLLGAEAAPAELFLQSFVLLMREGLEAILIVGALLAFLTRIGASQRVRDVRVGLVAALFASVLTAILIETVFHLSPASQEVLEGITMVAATVVLFSVSYWLLTKLEVAKWNRFVKDRVASAVAGGSSLALASVAFLAVYREGFETVLFYKALFVASGSGSAPPIVGGMLAAGVVLAITYLAMQRFGVRLPLKPFFGITSAFLYYMAFTFAGHGIAELQAGGLVPTTVLAWLPRIPRLGVYPTLETALAQGTLLVLAIAALAWIFVLEPRRARRALEDATRPEPRPAVATGHLAVLRSLDRMDADLAELRQEVARIREQLADGVPASSPSA